jgi:hypothetical protein
VKEKDSSYWQSVLATKNWDDDRSYRDGLVVEFSKPNNARNIKLVVNGKNTQLGYFALAELFKLKGESKLEWYAQLESDRSERDKFARWLMNEGMLHIQLWQHGEWKEITALPDVGPGIAKDQIAVIDVSNIPEDIVRIRLECTTDLWRIDQIYADYSPDYPLRSVELPLQRAIDESGRDVAALLRASDDRYYTTINDQYATLTFVDANRQQNTQRTYVVRTRGFYYQWLNADGRAQHAMVNRILTDPSFGRKTLMSRWLQARDQHEGISEVK